MDALRDLELLIRSRYPIIAVETHEEDRLEDLVARLAQRLDVPFFVWTSTQGLRRHGRLGPLYDTHSPVVALGNVAAMPNAGIYLFKDLHRYLGDPGVVRKLRDLARPFAEDRRALVLSAPRVALPPELERVAAVFRLGLPRREELRALVQDVVRELSAQHPVRVELSTEEIERLVDGLRGLTRFEAERALTKLVLDDLALTLQDLERVVEIKKALLEQDGLLEYVPPDEGLGAVGGLAALKRWLAKRRAAFGAAARRFGLEPPKGILLLGVQGCGKSLAAKAVARDWGLPLLKLEASRLYDKYVGESEKNLERALQTAERMAPCVLMIDELEKAFSHAGRGEGDAGLSRRVFGRLLGWLQDRTAPVFVVATSNHVAELPPELVRKGRFDEIFFVDLPTPVEREEIFTVHLQKRARAPGGFDLAALAAAASGFSGAEIEQAVVSALYTAFADGTDLTTALLVEEIRATRPLSVTRAEEIEALRAWARERAVPAN